MNFSFTILQSQVQYFVQSQVQYFVHLALFSQMLSRSLGYVEELLWSICVAWQQLKLQWRFHNHYYLSL